MTTDVHWWEKGNEVPIRVTDATPFPVALTGSASFAYTIAAPSVNAGVTLSGNIAEVAAIANIDRRYIAISVTNNPIFVRLIPASEDSSLRKGIYVGKGQTFELPVFGMYTGEISVINVTGNQAPTFYVTEY